MFKSVKYLDGSEEETKDIVRPGKVIAQFQNGDTFEGEYETTPSKGLMRTGKGVYTWSSGALYDGDYRDGKRHGHGIYKFPSGEVYDGNWENGVKFGKGVYTYTNGDVFHGEWVGDKRNGDGRFLNKKEKMEITGTWKNGHLIESTVQKKPIVEPRVVEVPNTVVEKKDTEKTSILKQVEIPETKNEEISDESIDKNEELDKTSDEKNENLALPVKVAETLGGKSEEDPVETLNKEEDAANLDPTEEGNENEKVIKQETSLKDTPEVVDSAKEDTDGGAEDKQEDADDEYNVKDMPEVIDPEKEGGVDVREKTEEEPEKVEDADKNDKTVEVLTLNEEAAEIANAPDKLKPTQDSKPMFIIITGAPASGKGTQCKNIAKDFGVVHLSTGDLLREAVSNGTESGKKAKTFMDKGELVPDDLINAIVKERLAEEDVQKRGVLLDGYPRTPAQAEELKDNGISVDACLLLEVPDDIVIQRAIGRRLDPETGAIYHLEFNPAPDDVKSRLIHRSDDTKDKVEERLVHYKRHLDNLKSFYNEVLHTVDGNKEHPIVWDTIKDILVEVEKKKSGEDGEDGSMGN